MNAGPIHYTFDPFQVYCFQRRAEISQQNIKANSSTITSLIASEWRKLSQREKQKYIDVANNLHDNAKTSQQFLKHLQQNKNQEKPDLVLQKEVSPPPSNYNYVEDLPQISIVRRGDFGREIEQISKQIKYFVD